jgi:putative Ca2+/H+ antiporter (TMEM165/GDT1 family)
MNPIKMLAGLVLNILGVLVLYKGIQTNRLKGFRESSVEIIAGIAFITMGFLTWLGYFS